MAGCGATVAPPAHRSRLAGDPRIGPVRWRGRPPRCRSLRQVARLSAEGDRRTARRSPVKLIQGVQRPFGSLSHQVGNRGQGIEQEMRMQLSANRPKLRLGREPHRFLFHGHSRSTRSIVTRTASIRRPHECARRSRVGQRRPRGKRRPPPRGAVRSTNDGASFRRYSGPWPHRQKRSTVTSTAGCATEACSHVTAVPSTRGDGIARGAQDGLRRVGRAESFGEIAAQHGIVPPVGAARDPRIARCAAGPKGR